MKKFLFLAIFSILSLPNFAFSQTRIEEQLSVTINPENPGPSEFFSVSIESFQTDLNKSEINYFINGELIEGGVGQKFFTGTTGRLGETTNLLIEIIKPNGSVLEKTYTISPGEIDIYYEADTYTPPFYKGKSEYTTQSRLKIVAIPNFSDSSGNIVDSDDVVYTWEINGDVDSAQSGTGRNVYYYEGGLISGPIEVILTASPITSDQTARIIKVIRPTNPEILVYEKNPIYGTIFDQVVNGNLTVERQEIELEAVPYGFSNDILNRGSFEWFLNGKTVDNFIFNNIIFRRTDNNPSSNNVIIEIQHNNKLLQAQRHSFILNFGEGSADFNF